MHTTVLYHGNCPDGHAAAFACWQQFGNEAQYLPVFYGQPVPEIPAEHTVYIVDFSYSERELKALLFQRIGHRTRQQPIVIVLDHHASAQRDLSSLQQQELPGLFIHFDLEECGASLVWKYFNGFDSIEKPDFKPLPTFFQYVRDRDLWQWKLPDSKAISLAYWVIDKDMLSIEQFAQDLDEAKACHRIITQGTAMQRYADALVKEQAARAVYGNIGGYPVPIVNATTLFSEVGDYLCQHGTSLVPEPPLFVAYYFDRTDGKRQWGLRSRVDFDCSVVAKQYGGGGHPGAAGFVTGQDWKGETL